MLIISAVNRGMRDIQYNNDYLFILINSMGALVRYPVPITLLSRNLSATCCG